MSSRYLAIKQAMMPRDTNSQGTIFGGVILSAIDQAGAIGARDEIIRLGSIIQGLVTVAMDKVEFHQPVLVGDIVSYLTRLVRVGRTSITMHVTVEVERGREVIKVTDAEVTYVAIDLTTRRPVPIRSE
jgi:acyl-CoA thioesterase YciA